MLQKPWNPYVRRHTALTEKAANPSINAVLEQHAGWIEGSGMKKKYTHHFSNKSNNEILEAYGILPKQSSEIKLRVKSCPQCNEPNTPESKFCAKYRMVLRYDGYVEAIEKQKENENKMQALEAKVDKLATWLSRHAYALDKERDNLADFKSKEEYVMHHEQVFKRWAAKGRNLDA